MSIAEKISTGPPSAKSPPANTNKIKAAKSQGRRLTIMSRPCQVPLAGDCPDDDHAGDQHHFHAERQCLHHIFSVSMGFSDSALAFSSALIRSRSLSLRSADGVKDSGGGSLMTS